MKNVNAWLRDESRPASMFNPAPRPCGVVEYFAPAIGAFQRNAHLSLRAPVATPDTVAAVPQPRGTTYRLRHETATEVIRLRCLRPDEGMFYHKHG
jgi:hypothetical protein